ncbi:MAG: DUF2269 domain-containing protein [Burkholderiaceae bacterium]|nr:DUF2269 domain-containing protein [Burkholderiaceae bacterium]
MNSYLILKWIHVLSSVLLVGTGFGSAYYMFFASRSGNVAAQAEVGRLVVRADWWFTAPTALVQPLTGLWLAHQGSWALDAPWIRWSLLFYGLAGACWLPVVWLQLRMYAMARHAAQSGSALPPLYARYLRWWERLGYIAFAAMLVIYYLMVVKPAP